MFTGPVTPDLLRGSVLAVPPLARHANLAVNREANAALIRHIEAGGVRTLLYGGNANFYNIDLGTYESLLGMLAELASADTWVIPSVGPAFGTMLDQAAVLKRLPFPTAMVLPPAGVFTPDGFEAGFRAFAAAYGRPAVLYIKAQGVIEVGQVKRLVADGLVSFVKYAIVRDDPSQDNFLRALVDVIDPRRIVSGIGEQPAIVHMRDFGVASFTSGCVCIAPALSAALLRAAVAGDWAEADRLRAIFRPLEDLRNAIHPIRVLHDAVTLSGLADMGPILPLLSNLAAAEREKVQHAARELLAAES